MTACRPKRACSSSTASAASRCAKGLRLLEAQGLITIRRGPGGGPIVGTVDPANLGRISTLYYHLVGATYRELFDAWAVAEGYLAERAARNDDRELVRGDARAVPRRSRTTPVSPSRSSYSTTPTSTPQLGTLAGNRVMQLSLMAIGQTVTHHVVLTADPRDVGMLIHDDHHEIADAVIAGKPIKARDTMRDHLVRVAEYYEKTADDSVLDKLIEWR